MKQFIFLILMGFVLVGSGCSNDPAFINSSSKKDCVEPENPYSSGGHSAGFEWGESGKSCGGRSTSFIEGCEEYLRQEELYENCLR